MPKVKDLTGRVFGRLTVLKFDGLRNHNAMWLCACACGKTKVLTRPNLLSGRTQSCGCFKSERNRELKTTHGHSVDHHESPTYKSWAHMVWRCTNPKSDKFKYYGERGIKVCERWLSFDAFLADMGPRPPGMTIERNDNLKGYEPGNCRWASRLEQAHNKRNNVALTHGGVTCCFSELCRHFNVPEPRTRWRLKHGWSVVRAFSTPGRIAA
jgi:hypothetical protein